MAGIADIKIGTYIGTKVKTLLNAKNIKKWTKFKNPNFAKIKAYKVLKISFFIFKAKILFT